MMLTKKTFATAVAAASLTALTFGSAAPAPAAGSDDRPARVTAPAFDGGPAWASPGDVGTAGATGARAADGPSVQELLGKCDRGEVNSCDFHPSGQENIQSGEEKFAGSGDNCSESVVTRNIQWSSTEGETNSVGVTIGASYGLKDAFEVSISTTYGHEWTWSKTQTDTVGVTLQPGQTAEVFVASDRSTVNGTYELHFEDPYYDHYIWYVNDVSVSAPTFNTPWHTRVETGDGC